MEWGIKKHNVEVGTVRSLPAEGVVGAVFLGCVLVAGVGENGGASCEKREARSEKRVARSEKRVASCETGRQLNAEVS